MSHLSTPHRSLDISLPAVEATQGQIDGFFSQLPYKYHLEEVAFVGDWLKISPWVASRVEQQLERRRAPSETSSANSSKVLLNARECLGFNAAGRHSAGLIRCCAGCTPSQCSAGPSLDQSPA